ncbi:unnamed protein product, partial [Meganyctiphanes norvegica]
CSKGNTEVNIAIIIIPNYQFQRVICYSVHRKMSGVDFEDLFQYIGSFGPLQKHILWVYSLVNVLYAWVYFGQMFMTLTPPHFCIPESVIKNYPLNDEFGDTNPNSCFLHTKHNRKFESNLVSDGNSTPCSNGWIYNYTEYYPTITSERDWVCEKDWLPPLAQLIFFFGAVVGSVGFGHLADLYGRVPVHAGANFLGGIAGVAACFSWSFTTFALCRFVVGMTLDWCYM